MGRYNTTARWNAFLLTALTWLLPIASTSAISQRDVSASLPGSTIGPGFVHVPISLTQVEPETAARLRRRAASGTELRNWQTGYSVNISLGNPGQRSTVIVDTGSFELWVNPDCSKASRAFTDPETGLVSVDSPLTDPAFCKQFGSFDVSKSSSVKQVTELPGRTFGYADFTTVTVNYVQDSLSIAGLTLQNQVFAVANASNATAIGIMGMGPNPLGFNRSYAYPLILESLVTQGAINSAAFSLSLQDFDNTTGSMILGGVDKGKFSGSLQKIPFETVKVTVGNQQFDHTSYWTKVTGMRVKSPKTSKDYNINGGFTAVVDSGTSILLFPNGLASQICTDINGTFPLASSNLCVVDCRIREQLTGGLTFSFGGKEITMSYQNLVNFNDFGSSGQYCSLAAADSTVVSDPPTYILGSPFLRSAYAVFDWENANLHLAQSANCGSEIVAIGKGTDSVPNVSGNCKSSTTSSLAVSSIARNQGLMLLGAVLSLTLLL